MLARGEQLAYRDFVFPAPEKLNRSRLLSPRGPTAYLYMGTRHLQPDSPTQPI